ncbi:organic solute transporter subunit alpha-like [Glandiceps talaboti]
MAFNNNSCSDDAPFAEDFITQMRPGNLFAICIAAMFTIIVIAMFIEAVWWLIHNIPYTQRRVRMIWNLGVYPVFCGIMFMAIMIPRSSVLASLTAGVYLSMAIYQFLLLIFDYSDGRNAMIEKMRHVKLKLASSPLACCCVCLPNIRLTRRRALWIRMGVMQVCILRPVVLYIAAVMWTNGNYTPGKIAADEAFLYLNSLSILSTFVAMYALGMLNNCAKQILEGYSLQPKFACIQIALLVANIQPMIFGILGSTDILLCTPPFSGQTKASWVSDYLVICEMFVLFLVAHHFYRREKGNIDTHRKFRAESFRTDYSTI